MEEKNKEGRPTKYKEEYCQGMIDYFAVQPQQVIHRKTYYADGTLKSEEPITLPAQLPTFQGYADNIGVHIDTLNEWGKVHEEFSESYARAKQLQEHIWLVNGMGGLYNSQFAQFFGKNCLGYKDKTEIESKNFNINNEVSGLTDEEITEELAKMGFKKE